jgi:hypothetical protein
LRTIIQKGRKSEVPLGAGMLAAFSPSFIDIFVRVYSTNQNE